MHTTTIETLPLPLNRQMLVADLATYAQRPANGQTGNSAFYGPDRGLLIQYADQDESGLFKRHIVPPEALLSLPLWEGLDGLDVPEGKSVAIDVERGRFAFLGDERPKPYVIPVVNYTYGFSYDIGGGPYERTPPLHLDDVEVLHVYVAEGCANESVSDVSERWKEPGPWQAQARTLGHAFAIWDKFYGFRVENDLGQAPQPTAVIHIMDNGLYGGRNVEGGNDLRCHLGPGSRLSIVAADGVRPAIRTLHNLVISCEPSPTAESAAPGRQLQLNGLLVHSQIVVPDALFTGSLSIDIDHCTLLPGGIAVEVNQPASQRTQLTIRRSLVGPVAMSSALEQLAVSDSIVDGLDMAAIRVDGEVTTGQTKLRRVTVLGTVALQALTYAQDCLFTGLVTLATVHEGDVVRYCYLQGLSAPAKELILENCEWGRPGFKPVFTSTAFGDPAYGQLSLETPAEIIEGAANGSSLGAFSRLNEPQRTAGIQSILEEYLPLSLEAELFFVT
jgi:hypothetical protein